MRDSKIIKIEDTRFIFDTNFSGDPERDIYGNDDRKANIVIPTEEQATDLWNTGFNVKVCFNKDDKERLGLKKTTAKFDAYLDIRDDLEEAATFYVPIIANYDSEWPPKIYLVSGDADPELLTIDTVKRLDRVYVLNVNAILNPFHNTKNGADTWSLYIRTMYVEQDVEDDPYAARYRRN